MDRSHEKDASFEALDSDNEASHTFLHRPRHYTTGCYEWSD